MDPTQSHTAPRPAVIPTASSDAYQTGVGSICEVRQYETIFNGRGEKSTLRSGARHDLSQSNEGSSNVWSAQAALVVTTERDLDTKNVVHTELVVQSPYMNRALKACVPEFKDTAGNILIWDEPRCIFYFRKELEEYSTSLSGRNAVEAKRHVKFLLDYMYNSLATDIRHFKQFTEPPNGKFALGYSGLWMAFVPGELAHLTEDPAGLWPYSRCLRIGRITRRPCSKVESSGFGYIWKVTCYRLAYDGGSLDRVADVIDIEPYSGTKELHDLSLIPFRYHKKRKAWESRLLQQGKKYLAAGVDDYLRYKGEAILLGSPPANCGREPAPRRAFVDGHIIVNYIGCFNAFPSYTPRLLSSDKYWIPGSDHNLSDEEIMTCSSEVAGYSIEHNSWGFFHIHYTSDAKFNAEAFGSLVYPEDHKHMMLTLVQSHQVLVVNYYNGHEYTEKQYEEGHVFLLYGPSGTGKTLAIQSLAEDQNMPLIKIEPDTLGDDVASFTINLKIIFQQKSALLVLEKADAFLSKENLADPHQRAIAAAFIRALNSFGGILFLTAETIDAFDDSFRSRIHSAFEFPKLDYDARAKVWENLVYGKDTSMMLENWLTTQPNLMEKLGFAIEKPLNGHQIKNVIRMAFGLAKRKGESLGVAHITVILNHTQALHGRDEPILLLSRERSVTESSSPKQPLKRRRIREDPYEDS